MTGPGPVPMSTRERERALCVNVSVCVCVLYGGEGKVGRQGAKACLSAASYAGCEKTKMSCHCNSQDALLFSIAAAAAATAAA